MKTRKTPQTVALSYTGLDWIAGPLEKVQKTYSALFDAFTGSESSLSRQKTFLPRVGLLSRNLKIFSKKFPLLLLALLIIAAFVVSTSYIARASKPADTRIQVRPAKASMAIHKEFLFPIVDAQGKTVTKLKYVVDTAELRDEIIVKGQKATMVKGRTFLVLTLKLTNDFDKPIDLKASSFVRLVVNGKNEEQLAPDIHNDPVNVQPRSTKTSRLGFAISDTDKKLTLLVGELNGTKQSIVLDLK